VRCDEPQKIAQEQVAKILRNFFYAVWRFQDAHAREHRQALVVPPEHFHQLPRAIANYKLVAPVRILAQEGLYHLGQGVEALLDAATKARGLAAIDAHEFPVITRPGGARSKA
jgi:hypothetical protein